MEPHIKAGEDGFTYVAALFLVAMLTYLSMRAVQDWHMAELRDKELQLLFVGEQYRHAIQTYYELSPGSVKKYPADLADLLIDKRATRLIRPIRQLFADPMSSNGQWGVVTAPTGGIMGVYSLSTDTPIKQDGFVSEESAFVGARHYSEWQFIYIPPKVSAK